MQKKYVPLVAFFTVLLVFAAHLGARLAASAPVFAFAEEKRTYLTLADGPSTLVTGSILDTLRQEGVKATFFVVSDRIRGREEILRRIVREGHSVGVHSATHRYKEIYASDEALLRDVSVCAKTVARVCGRTPRLYRFPGGLETAHRRALLEQNGYRIVRWNAVCGDEELKNAPPEALCETSLKTARERNVVVLLLHDSAPHRATAEALPAIIRRFRALGYVFCAY